MGGTTPPDRASQDQAIGEVALLPAKPRAALTPPGASPRGQAGAGPFLAMTSYPRGCSSTHWPKLGAAWVT